MQGQTGGKTGKGASPTSPVPKGRRYSLPLGCSTRLWKAGHHPSVAGVGGRHQPTRKSSSGHHLRSAPAGMGHLENALIKLVQNLIISRGGKTQAELLFVPKVLNSVFPLS